MKDFSDLNELNYIISTCMTNNDDFGLKFYLKGWIEKNPQDINAGFTFCKVAEKTHFPEDTNRFIEHISTDKLKGYDLGCLGFIFIEIDESEKSIGFLQKAIKNSKDDLFFSNEYYKNLGIAYILLGDFEKAKETFQLNHRNLVAKQWFELITNEIPIFRDQLNNSNLNRSEFFIILANSKFEKKTTDDLNYARLIALFLISEGKIRNNNEIISIGRLIYAKFYYFRGTKRFLLKAQSILRDLHDLSPNIYDQSLDQNIQRKLNEIEEQKNIYLQHELKIEREKNFTNIKIINTNNHTLTSMFVIGAEKSEILRKDSFIKPILDTKIASDLINLKIALNYNPTVYGTIYGKIELNARNSNFMLNFYVAENSKIRKIVLNSKPLDFTKLVTTAYDRIKKNNLDDVYQAFVIGLILLHEGNRIKNLQWFDSAIDIILKYLLASGQIQGLDTQ